MSTRRRRPQAVRRLSASRRRGHRGPGTLVLLLLGFGVLFLPRPIAAAEPQADDGPAAVVAAAGLSDEPQGPLLLAVPRDEAGPAPAPPGRGPGPQKSDVAAARPPTARAAPGPGPANLYELAAARYGVSSQLLRALHEIESGGAVVGCLANREGSGALGPFQFMPATFGLFGVDADGDGRADICSFVDSLFSAARYLRALGADADPASPASQRALRLYGTDVARVAARVS